MDFFFTVLGMELQDYSQFLGGYFPPDLQKTSVQISSHTDSSSIALLIKPLMRSTCMTQLPVLGIIC